MATTTITISDKVRFVFNYSLDSSLSTATKAVYAFSMSSITSATLSHPYEFEAIVYIDNVPKTLSDGTIARDGTVRAQSKLVTVDYSKAHSLTTDDVVFGVIMVATDGSYEYHNKTVTKTISIGPETSYQITYDANGHGSNPSPQTKWYSTAINLRTMSDQGNYKFKNWNTKADGSGTSYAGGASCPNQTLKLYAQWYSPNTITYYGNGATSGSTVTQYKKYGTTVAIKANSGTGGTGFSRTGHTFLGWATSASATTPSSAYEPNDNYSSNANLKLYAVWKAHKYTIKFNANGGSGSMSNMAMTYGQKKALTANAFSRTGHTFMGWNTNAAGTGTSYANKAEVSNLTASDNGTVNLYAKWRDDYAKPQISSLVATRVNSGRVGDDEGEYILATCIFTYDNAVDIGITNTPNIKIEYTVNNGTKVAASVDPLSISGTRVTASSLIGPITAAADKKIVVIATAYDTYGGGISSSNISVLSRTLFPVFHDFELYPHGGAAFGRAPRANWLDVGNGFSAAFASNGRFDTTDAGHSFASASSATNSQGDPVNEYGNTWNCYDSAGNHIGYSQVVNTHTGVYRSFAVKNPRTGKFLAIYLYSNDDGTGFARLSDDNQWEVADIPNLPASKITSGTFNADRIPGLAASKITSGTFDTDRIPNLAAGKITSGTFAVARIPSLSLSKISDAGTLAGKDSGKVTAACNAQVTVDTYPKTYTINANTTTTVDIAVADKTGYSFGGITRVTTGVQGSVGVEGFYLESGTVHVYLRNHSSSKQENKTVTVAVRWIRTSGLTPAVTFS